MIVVQEWADGDVGLLDTEKEKNEIYATPDKEYGATQIQVTKQKAVFSFLPNKNDINENAFRKKLNMKMMEPTVMNMSMKKVLRI